MRPPIAAPKRFGLAATCSSVAAAARNSRSYTTLLLASARRASGSGTVKTEVHVADGQELLLSRSHPRAAGGREALGTMAIPTAVVREGRRSTLLTAIAVAAERCRSALGHRAEDAPMLPGDPGAGRLEKMIAVLAHDVGHLEGWPRHRWCFNRVRRAVSGPEIVSASSGFATACSCFWERWRYSTVCRIST